MFRPVFTKKNSCSSASTLYQHSPAGLGRHQGKINMVVKETDLTLDLQMQILTWLPAPVVLQFRFVSKAWNVATRSADFIDQHLSRAIQSQTNPRRPTNFMFVSPDVNSTTTSELGPGSELRWSLAGDVLRHWHVVSTCNGLLCLQWQQTHHICIFNPTINHHFYLPSSDPKGTTICYVMGFGLDTTRKEYKVLAVAKLNVTRSTNMVVCNVSRGGLLSPWRLLKQPHTGYTQTSRWKPQVLVKGKLYFTMLKFVKPTEPHPIVLSFDLQSDQLAVLLVGQVVPGPWNKEMLVLTQFGDCLGLVKIWNGEVKVFKRIICKNWESWIPMFEFYSEFLKPLDTIQDRIAGVSCLLKDGKLYICWGNLVLSCDLKRGQYDVRSDLRCNSFGFPSITSLVSLTN